MLTDKNINFQYYNIYKTKAPKSFEPILVDYDCSNSEATRSNLNLYITNFKKIYPLKNVQSKRAVLLLIISLYHHHKLHFKQH